MLGHRNTIRLSERSLRILVRSATEAVLTPGCTPTIAHDEPVGGIADQGYGMSATRYWAGRHPDYPPFQRRDPSWRQQFRRVTMGPLVASQVRQLSWFVPRLKYDAIRRLAAIA